MLSRKNFVSYKPLIDKWEEFLLEDQNASVENFARWILGKSKSDEPPNLNDSDLQRHFDMNNEIHGFAYLGPEASFLIWKLYKFLRLYTKEVFRRTGLSGHDEFAVLAHVEFKEGCTKKTAIEENMIDLTTGIAIVNRLVSKRLLREKTNPRDRREKILSLTAKGRTTLQKVYEGLAATEDVLANLGPEERERLVGILKFLDAYHTQKVEASKASDSPQKMDGITRSSKNG